MPWTSPLTSTGRSALVPDGPWSYIFDVVAVQAKGDPGRLREVLPEALEPTEDIWFYIADIISFSPNAEELNYEAPGLLQYKEAAIFVRSLLNGKSYAYCPFMYVDSDVSLVRGLVAGFPKKIAHIEMTRFHDLFKPKKYGGLAYRAGYGLMKLLVEPAREVDKLPFDDFGTWLLRRYIKPLGIDELVEFAPDLEYSKIVEGRGSVEVGGGINDELHMFEPVEVLRGYLYSVRIGVRELRVLGKG